MLLGLDLDVEAELGLDSIKQVEIVRELEQTLGVELDAGDGGRRYQVTTLRGLIDSFGQVLPQAPSTGAQAAAPTAADLATQVVGLVADKTGYPPDVIDVDLDVEAELVDGPVRQEDGHRPAFADLVTDWLLEHSR